MHFSALRTTLLAGFCVLAATAASAQTADFISCLDGIKAEAVRQGVPAAVADRALANLTPDQKVLDLDSRQPEFSLTYGKYIGSAVSPTASPRVSRSSPSTGPSSRRCSRNTACRRNTSCLLGHGDQLRQLHGDFQVVRSVATLACMTKRTAFFSNETVQALKILAANGMTAQQMRGSWAGRHGQHPVHALDLHALGDRRRPQRQSRSVDQPA